MEPTTAAALYTDISLSNLSLVHIAAILALTLPSAALFGYLTGTARRKRLLKRGKEVERTVSETAQGAFLALVGLLLAFTFGNSLSIAQSIKAAATDEAAALGTAFLRADYLAEPGRTDLKVAIFDYASTRLVPQDEPIDTQAELRTWLETSLKAQARLWPLTLAATREPTPPPIQAFVAGAVNDALDAHLYRLATHSVPIAAFTQAVGFAASVMAVFLLADRTGLLGRSLTWRVFLFSFLAGLVLYTVVDVRRGFQGLIRVDQSELRATIFDMDQSLAQRE